LHPRAALFSWPVFAKRDRGARGRSHGLIRAWKHLTDRCVSIAASHHQARADATRRPAIQTTGSAKITNIGRSRLMIVRERTRLSSRASKEWSSMTLWLKYLTCGTGLDFVQNCPRLDQNPVQMDDFLDCIAYLLLITADIWPFADAAARAFHVI
jgi:hypothetical protein